MQYLCLVYLNRQSVASLPPAEQLAVAAEGELFEQEMHASGRVIALSQLADATSVVTVSRPRGHVLIQHGSSHEGAEDLDHCLLIEARDLNDAIRTASCMPLGRFGHIEVRPLRGAPVAPLPP